MDFLSSGSSRHGDEPPVQQEYTQHEWDEWKSHKRWQALDARPHCVSDGTYMDDVEPRYATVEDQLADVPEDVVSFLNDMDAINAEFEMWPRAPDGSGRKRNTSPPVPQPCEPTPYVLLGDLDDLTIEVMRQHHVGTVISMRPEKMESSNTILLGFPLLNNFAKHEQNSTLNRIRPQQKNSVTLVAYLGLPLAS